MVGHLLGEKGDHVADGDGGGLGEVLVEAHGDVVGRGFGARPEKWGFPVLLVDDELEGAGELGFHGGDVDLAVALAGVAVASFEERAFGMDGDEEGGAFDHLLVVHVAGVDIGRGGVELAHLRRRRDAHAAEEGVQRDGDAGREGGGHFLKVEGDDLGVAVGKVGSEEAVLAGSVAGPGNVDVDFLDADFEDVTGLGFCDGDGAGENVAAGAALGLGDLVVDVGDVGRDVGVGDAAGFQAGGRAAGGEGLHDDGVARVNAEDGFGLRPVIAPGDSGGSGEQGVGLLGNGCRRKEREGGAESGASAGKDDGHETFISLEGRRCGACFKNLWAGMDCDGVADKESAMARSQMKCGASCSEDREQASTKYRHEHNSIIPTMSKRNLGCKLNDTRSNRGALNYSKGRRIEGCSRI